MQGDNKRKEKEMKGKENSGIFAGILRAIQKLISCLSHESNK